MQPAGGYGDLPPHQREAGTEADARESARFREWFLECVIVPLCASIFSERGVSLVSHLLQPVTRGRQGIMQFDLLCLDAGRTVVAVDVLRAVSMDDACGFLDRLGDFHGFFRSYRDRELYGVLCGVRTADHAARFAVDQGVFVCSSLSEEDPLRVINPPGFVPRIWHARDAGGR